MGSKIVEYHQIQDLINNHKEKHKTTVLVGGYFDLLHIGHVRFLQKCKELGDILFVYVHTDRSAKRIKGWERPIIPQNERAELISALQCVDFAVLLEYDLTDMSAFELDYRLIKDNHPDFYVRVEGSLGEAARNELEELGTKVVLLPRQHSSRSTTSIIAEMVSKLNVKETCADSIHQCVAIALESALPSEEA